MKNAKQFLNESRGTKVSWPDGFAIGLLIIMGGLAHVKLAKG